MTQDPTLNADPNIPRDHAACAAPTGSPYTSDTLSAHSVAPMHSESNDAAPSDAGTDAIARSDTLALYRWAVQDPETHAVVLRLMYQQLRPGRHPVVLREDFAGTSAESVAWVALKPGRRAFAIDLDPHTLAWAESRANRLLGPRSSGVTFVEGDAISIAPPRVPPADILSVLNFSILYLREATQLRAYLRNALEGLSPDGVLVLNTFGGPDALRPGTTRHRVNPSPRLASEPPIPAFEYQWEVRSFNAVSRLLDCRIHFTVPGATKTPGHEIRDAFQYNWRLWSTAELMHACTAAGFSNVQVWRHTYDPTKGAAGVFLGSVDPRTLETLSTWTAYVVASR